MRLIEHKNNSAWWSAKNGRAGAEDIAKFAKQYQREDAGAWCVMVREGEDWVEAEHVRALERVMLWEGIEAVWVSDGSNAQCVWRR